MIHLKKLINQRISRHCESAYVARGSQEIIGREVILSVVVDATLTLIARIGRTDI